MENLYQNVPDRLSKELIDVLTETDHVRIERIVSTGQSSPDGFWYDQIEAEWLVVLRGQADLLFEGDADPIHMSVGDHINIPAHRKHRVESTATDEPTVWLAVFYSPQ